MLLSNQTKPYEVNKGESMALVDSWIKTLTEKFKNGSGFTIKEQKNILDNIAESFSQIQLDKSTPKVKVGIVGEIYVKYARLGNNNLEQFLADQDCEVCVLGIMGFALFKVDNRLEDIKLYGGSRIKFNVVKILFDYLVKMETLMIESTAKYGFIPPGKYAHTKELVKGVIGYGSKMGEGGS